MRSYHRGKTSCVTGVQLALNGFVQKDNQKIVHYNTGKLSYGGFKESMFKKGLSLENSGRHYN